MEHNIDKHYLLHRLVCEDEWNEDLLSDFAFGFEIRVVLTKTERFVCHRMIELMDEGYTAKECRRFLVGELNNPLQTIIQLCSNVKRKLRHGMETNVVREVNKELEGGRNGRKRRS